MATTPKRIQRIQGPISALNAGQIGVEDTVDADLGFRMHGGKDGAGGVTKWLAKDKPARVSEMTVQDLAGSGERVMSVDSNGKLMLGSGLVVPEHKTSHQLGGTDALNVGGLSGALADGQKTNPDLKTLRGEGSLANKLYSAAGLQNAWEWGSRIETEDGQLFQLHHDPVQNARLARIVGGQQNPNLISNPDFFTNTSGWTASSGTVFIRSGLSSSDWPEPFNLTDQSANQLSYCGRANKSTSSPFGVSQTGILQIGKRYRVSGWINNLAGTSEIVAYVGGVVVANATTGNEWKYFDTEITAANADVLIQSEPTGVENSIFYFAHFRAYAVDSNEGLIEISTDGGQKVSAKSGSRTIEKNLLEGTVTDTETVKNIGLGATTGDVSFAKKVIIVESDNDTAGGLGTAGRLTLTAEASNEAGYDGDSAYSIDAFDGLVEKRIVSSGILGGTTFHDIIAQSFLVNGEPQGVQFVTTVADTPHVMTIASAKKIIFEGSASNAVCELPAANSTATLSDGTVVTMRGRSFELVNSSSEFIPVQNSGEASSVFELLGPGCTLTATCTGVSTAAGTWTKAIVRPEGYLRYFSDFDKPVGSTTQIPDVYTYLGAGSSAAISASGTFNQWGSGLCIIGTDAGLGGFINCVGGVYISAQEYYFNYGKPILYRAKLHQLTRSDATNDTRLRFGFLNVSTGAQPTAGIYFQTNATDQISGVTRASSTETVVAGTAQIKLSAGLINSDLILISNSAATRIDFWVDKTYLGASSANIPKIDPLGYGWQMTRSAGVANNRIYVDSMTIERPV